MLMPEQQFFGSGSPEILKLPIDSYREYVKTLAGHLRLSKNPQELYEKSAMDLGTWLSNIELPRDSPSVDAELTVGPDTIYKKGVRNVELHSNDPLPKNLDDLGKHNTKRLGWYALAEAKLQYLEKNYEDLPALRGFNIQAQRYDIRSQADYYIKHCVWKKDQTPIMSKIKRAITQGAVEGALSVVAAACGLKGISIQQIEAHTQDRPVAAATSPSIKLEKENFVKNASPKIESAKIESVSTIGVGNPQTLERFMKSKDYNAQDAEGLNRKNVKAITIKTNGFESNFVTIYDPSSFNELEKMVVYFEIYNAHGPPVWTRLTKYTSQDQGIELTDWRWDYDTIPGTKNNISILSYPRKSLDWSAPGAKLTFQSVPVVRDIPLNGITIPGNVVSSDIINILTQPSKGISE